MAEKQELTGPDFEAGIADGDIPEGTPVVGHAHGEPVVIVRSGDRCFAVGATCSHYGGPLGEGIVVGDTIRCPWHHARFDLQTGDAIAAPALSPVPCYEVLRKEGRLVVGPKKPVPKPPVTLPVSPKAVVIIGAGASGAAAAERLRRLGYTGTIMLIGDEPPGPVDRPNLSKDYLAGTAPEEWIPLRSRKFYEKNAVELRIGDAVVDIDTSRKIVVLESGGSVPYDALLLAVGAAPVRLALEVGAGAPPVFTLRTLADAHQIIEAATKAKRAVVIGSSFIGLETAASLRTRGLEVDVVGRDRLPLERVLGEELGHFVQQIHEAQGVCFHLQASPRSVGSRGVELEDGRVLPADLVVLGVGVRPRTELASKAGLQVDNGIVVDPFLRTSAPGIWAAGDSARYPEARLGTLVRIEHWVVAQRQGQAAAHDMLGLGAPFRDVPFFWSQHYDIRLAYVGHAASWESAEVVGDIASRDAIVAYRRGGRVLAVAAVGRDRQSLAIEAALESGDEDKIESLLRS